MLSLRGSVPGTGWGCFVCGLPSDGACYVACDRCIKNEVPPRFAVRGYAESGEREPIDTLSPERFKHDMSKHPGEV